MSWGSSDAVAGVVWWAALVCVALLGVTAVLVVFGGGFGGSGSTAPPAVSTIQTEVASVNTQGTDDLPRSPVTVVTDPGTAVAMGMAREISPFIARSYETDPDDTIERTRGIADAVCRNAASLGSVEALLSGFEDVYSVEDNELVVAMQGMFPTMDDVARFAVDVAVPWRCPELARPGVEPEIGAGEQAVLLYFPTSDSGLVDSIEIPMIEAIEVAAVGEFDGQAVGPDETILYMYGPDADALLDAIFPLLRRAGPPSGSYAVKRYGPPGSNETRVELG